MKPVVQRWLHQLWLKNIGESRLHPVILHLYAAYSHQTPHSTTYDTHVHTLSDCMCTCYSLTFNIYCTHKSTLIPHQPLSRTQLTWGNSSGRRAHREAACCPSRGTLCRAQGSGGDSCSEGEQSNTPQTLCRQHGTTLSTYTCTYVDINTPYSTCNHAHAQS